METKSILKPEEWRPVPAEHYEHYHVSSLGRVKNTRRGNFMKPDKTNNTGYYRIRLKSNPHEWATFIHKLVALAFVPNPENKPCVNHKNGDKYDNSATNLEWVTEKENARHARETGLNSMKGNKNQNKPRPVDVLIAGTGVIRHFKTMTEAAKFAGVSTKCIRNFLNNGRNQGPNRDFYFIDPAVAVEKRA